MNCSHKTGLKSRCTLLDAYNKMVGNSLFYDNIGWVPTNVTNTQIMESGYVVPSSGIIKSFTGWSKLRNNTTGGLKDIQFRLYKVTPTDGATSNLVAVEIGTAMIIQYSTSASKIYLLQNIYSTSNTVNAGDVLFFTFKRVDCVPPACPSLDLQISGNITIEVN
jgi:hypothetical protein